MNRTPQRSQSKSSTPCSRFSADTCKRITIACIVLNIIFLVILLVLSIVWRTHFDQPNGVDKNQLFCIDCKKIENAKGKEEYITKQENEKEVCCAKASVIVDDLVKQKIEENQKEEKERDRFSHDYLHCSNGKNNTRPATRMVGIEHPTESNSNELQWGTDGELTFTHEKIAYMRGKLKPRHPGIYYLYSQVTVNLNAPLTSPIVHTVYRKRSRDGTVEKLLEGSISSCQLSVNKSDSTSYLGSSFILDMNDEILVKMTHPSIIKYESMAGNYFGMHKI